MDGVKRRNEDNALLQTHVRFSKNTMNTSLSTAYSKCLDFDNIFQEQQLKTKKLLKMDKNKEEIFEIEVNRIVKQILKKNKRSEECEKRLKTDKEKLVLYKHS